MKKVLSVKLSEKEWELLYKSFELLEIDAENISEAFREFLMYALYALIETRRQKSWKEFLRKVAELGPPEM